MKVYLVTYDLNKAGQDYNSLIRVLKSYSYKHPMQSVWFLKTSDSASTIYNKIDAATDSNDYVFITAVSTDRQGWLLQDVWDFING